MSIRQGAVIAAATIGLAVLASRTQAAITEQVLSSHPMVALFHGRPATVGDTLKLQAWYRSHYGFACKEILLVSKFGVDCASRTNPEGDHDMFFGQLSRQGVFLVQVGRTIEKGNGRDLLGDRLAVFVTVNTGGRAPVPISSH